MTISLITENIKKYHKKPSPFPASDKELTAIATGQSILLIADDQRLANSFKWHLNTNGYNVHKKERNETVEHCLVEKKIDMIILDIGFSDVSSLTMIKTIRAFFKGPLVILTSRISEQEQVIAFQLGADEYIVKPASENILLIRVSALFRRQGKIQVLNEEASIDLGELSLYPLSYKCQLNGNDVTLTQFEFRLLRILVENVGRIMSRDTIYSTLLGRAYNGVERTIDVRMSQLRDKLTKQNSQKIRIETVWGQGYMLNQM